MIIYLHETEQNYPLVSYFITMAIINKAFDIDLSRFDY